MPEEDDSDVDIAGEVDLTAEGSVRRQDVSAAAQEDQTGPETLTVAIVASGEGNSPFGSAKNKKYAKMSQKEIRAIANIAYKMQSDLPVI